MQHFPFIDLLKLALHVSGDKLAHLQDHFLTAYTAFGTMYRPVVGSNIGTLYPKLYMQSKSDSEDGRVCRLKHVALI